LGRYYSVGETAGLKGQKRSLFAGGVRVPFIARWPGVIPQGRVDRTSVISAVDLLPTFIELAGAKLPEEYAPDGESVVGALTGEPFKRSKPIFWEWPGGHGNEFLWPHLGVRDGRWKLMVNRELGKTELYDIEADWAEQDNLAQRHPAIVKKLTETVLAWKASCPTEPPEHCISKLRGPDNDR
jgi:N-acetylgalactosamine-6-sulfatase